jgi:hypothetical protein
MANIKPQFDRFEDDPPRAPDVEQTRREYAVQQFFADLGDDWFAGMDDSNAIMLRQYLEMLDRPVTRRNLMIAWRELNEGGFLEKPFDPQYRSVFVPDVRRGAKTITSTLAPARHSPLNQAECQLIGERPERLEELGGAKLRAFAAERKRLNKLSEIGKPVSHSLKAEYKQSLATEHSKQGLPKRWAEARAVIALNYPAIKRDSAEFNQLVAAEVARVS